MAKYRTPDEDRLQEEAEARIRDVLDQVVHNGASCKVAMILGEAPEVVERWVDALYDGLRASLSDDRPDQLGLRQEDRLAAIVLLLEERMTAEADAILRGMREAGDE